MADSRAVRVVVIRGGRTRPTDFALRRGESGLSLFGCESDEQVRIVVEAVRAAGKSGPLAAAALAEDDLLSLGLQLVQTPGGTPDPRANDLHVEARLGGQAADLARRLGQEPWEYFNQQVAAAIHARAKVIYEA